MTARAHWTPLARDELRQIYRYIGRQEGRRTIAAGVARDIRAKVDRYAEMPNIGQHHPLLPADWQYFRFKRWIVVYRENQEGIDILRVIDGSRDLPSLV